MIKYKIGDKVKINNMRLYHHGSIGIIDYIGKNPRGGVSYYNVKFRDKNGEIVVPYIAYEMELILIEEDFSELLIDPDYYSRIIDKILED